jgi:ribokinase
LVQSLAAGGVDVKHIRRHPDLPSGVAVIMVDAEGRNQIVVVPGANGAFGPDELEECRGLIAEARIVLLQLEIPSATVEAAARMAKQCGALVILDPAPAQEISRKLLALVDYLTPNETELAILTNTDVCQLNAEGAAEKAIPLLKAGVRNVLVKMGSQGALLSGEQGLHFWPSVPVRTLDTTAAGDAFNGAFAFALASGRSVAEAGTFASAAAACSVTRAGAQPSMPTRVEVENLLRQTASGVQA